MKAASVDVSRDIEESARPPTIVNEVRAAAAANSFETTQSATSSDIVVQTVETPTVDKSTSDVVQPNEKPSSDAYKPTVIRRFEKISTAQTVSSSVAVATTTTSTTTAKVIESRMSRLSSVRGNTVLEVSQ